ncbi:unnamed protein product [Lactuca virosa]|uniref:Uncharacterized protein n=1 Tax=Lactuca virosa TaxID=75947 RepID=A0AAU9LBK4_9ASTR|nr:unnamed protein product [Lactuca virosa]
MLPKLEKAKINRVAMALKAEHVDSETTIPGYGTLGAKMNEEYGDTVPSKPHQVPNGVPLVGSSVKHDVLEEEREESGTTSESKEKVIIMASRLSLASKELSLGGHGLSVVPPQVWETSDITKFDLSRNTIEDLPVELSSCASLETLVLSRNNIKMWPSAILKSLQHLVCLKLDTNPLKQIPSDGFEAASKLQILDLSGNVGCLPEYPAFSSLLRMQIPEVKVDIISLPKLRIRDTSQNSIETILEGFKNATSLQELRFSDNNLSALPAELGLLEPTLQVLQLDGNPLRSIPRTILDRGTKAILSYLKDRSLQESTQIIML